MDPQIQYAKTEDGVSIAYATEGEGPALVLVPNPPSSHVQRGREMMPNFFQPLVRGFRLIAYDPRGAGLSDRDAIDYAMEAMMRDIDAVVERTGLQSFAVLAFRGAVPVADDSAQGGIAHPVPPGGDHATIFGKVGADEGDAGIDVGRMHGQVDSRAGMKAHASAMDLRFQRLLRRRLHTSRLE